MCCNTAKIVSAGSSFQARCRRSRFVRAGLAPRKHLSNSSHDFAALRLVGHLAQFVSTCPGNEDGSVATAEVGLPLGQDPFGDQGVHSPWSRGALPLRLVTFGTAVDPETELRADPFVTGNFDPQGLRLSTRLV